MEINGKHGSGMRIEFEKSLKSRIEAIMPQFFKEGGRYLVAYSGGVDSTFLTYLCKVFKVEYTAVTVKSEVISKKEFEEAINVARRYGFRHNVVDLALLEFPEFVENNNLRCYFCKKRILEAIKGVDKGAIILDGTNADDLDDFRPGLKASEEIGVLSPLKELRKEEIREISKDLDLITWKKPSNSCLATRILDGKVEKRKLEKIEEAEKILHNKGFELVRVRVRHLNRTEFIESGKSDTVNHFDSGMKNEFNSNPVYENNELSAIVQVAANKLQHLEKVKGEISLRLKGLGFQRVFFDPEGYPSEEIE